MLRKDFNDGWKVGKNISSLTALIKGRAPDPIDVTLPHDAMIHSDRDPQNASGGGNAYFAADNLEYTKTVFFPTEDKGKVIYLEFEGVYMDASVWVNNDFAGKHFCGYSNFYVKINDFINYGEENTIKVIVKVAAYPNSRWYSGAGIYRNVKLIIGQALHIKTDGVMISTPSVDPEITAVEITTEIENEELGFKRGYIISTIKNGAGEEASKQRTRFNIKSNESLTVRQRLYVKNPALWDLDTPNLYTCETELEADGSVIDTDINTFGVRSLSLDPINGFRLNGKTVKFKGGCIHHDNGILGAATFEDAEYRRVKLHKQAGYNALRSAHQPMSKAMLDACDRLGMLVMDELSDVWTETKVEFDYGNRFADFWEKDTELMVKKDFNHPSVVMYSIGNEIQDIGSDRSSSWGRKIAEKIRSMDKTRYITNGLNVMMAIGPKIREIMKSMGINTYSPGVETGEINQIMTDLRLRVREILKKPETFDCIEESRGVLDINGYNYNADQYERDLNESPNNIVIGTETHPKALDVNWELVMKYDHVLGDFSWTSWDYLGEVGIGHTGYDDDKNPSFYGAYPWISAYCGDFDMTGWRKPISYWREIIWGGRDHTPYIAVQRPERYGQQAYPSDWGWTDSFASWTWPGFEGKNMIVEVYSDAEEIELLINGESQGRKTVGDDFKKFYCKFDVEYKTGTVEAVAYIADKEAGRFSLKTADTPYLKATKERESIRANTNDLCYVNIELTDKDGVLNTSFNKKVTVGIEGPAVIAGSGSGNPRMEERYSDLTHETFYGRMQAIVRPLTEKGTAKLTFSADGTESVTVEIPVV